MLEQGEKKNQRGWPVWKVKMTIVVDWSAFANSIPVKSLMAPTNVRKFKSIHGNQLADLSQ